MFRQIFYGDQRLADNSTFFDQVPGIASCCILKSFLKTCMYINYRLSICMGF